MLTDLMPLRASLAFQVARADRALTSGLATALAPERTSVEQWRIMQSLADAPGQPMGALAGSVLMPHPTLTKAVDRLVDRALVYRRPDPNDRRRVVVHLSDRGRALLDRLAPRVRAHQEAVTTALGEPRVGRLMTELDELVVTLIRTDAAGGRV